MADTIDVTVASQLNTVAAQSVQMLGAAAARGVLRQADHADNIGRESAQTFLYDQRLLSGVLADELIGSTERFNVEGLNTAIRTPSTIDHYALGAGPAAPGAPAGSAPASTAKAA